MDAAVLYTAVLDTTADASFNAASFDANSFDAAIFDTVSLLFLVRRYVAFLDAADLDAAVY